MGQPVTMTIRTEGDQCFAGDCKAGANICTELCGNDIDDDFDRATDCEDFACAGSDNVLRFAPSLAPCSAEPR